MSSSLRRYDLDWLRVFAVLLLVPFHSALIFSLSPEHTVYIKDRVESPPLLALDGFLYLWHMPLLFVIAGAATWFALRRRTAGEYVRERVLRLLIPLIFSVFTLIPLMTYVHNIGRRAAPTLAEHYATFFTIQANDLGGMRGHFTPAHLWFILFLFVFSLLALPLFLWLRGDAAATARGAIVRVLRSPIALLLVVLPLMLLAGLPGLADKNPFYFLALFILGFLLMADESVSQRIARWLPLSLIIALITTGVYFAPYFGLFMFPRGDTTAATLYRVANEVARWTWVLVLMGIFYRWARTDNAFLRYTNEAAYPFYILHLPVNTLVGYVIVRMDTSVGVKFILINLFTFALTFLIYDIAVKRLAITRFLFGMKPKAAPEKFQPPHAQPSPA